jgi:hypothetical protein
MFEYSAEPVFKAVSTTTRNCPRTPLEPIAGETWAFMLRECDGGFECAVASRFSLPKEEKELVGVIVS